MRIDDEQPAEEPAPADPAPADPAPADEPADDANKPSDEGGDAEKPAE